MCSYLVSFWKNIAPAIKKTCLAAAILFCVPGSAFGAALTFSPASGSYQVGTQLTVGVYADSGSEALNALSGTVSFPAGTLEVLSVSTNQSIVSLWVAEPDFSNIDGTVRFEGIVLNPGYTGKSGKVITITFLVKAEGQAGLSFTSGSILANDGEGSEILSAKGGAQFTISRPSAVVTPPTTPLLEETTDEPVESVKGPLPVVTSETHPQDGWSNKFDAVFNFVLPGDIEALRLLVDDVPTSIPTVLYNPPIKTREIRDLAEGVSYLHVQYKDAAGWGEILHYKLQIDQQPPVEVAVREVEQGAFLLTAEDTSSGLAYYEIQIDGGEVEKFIDDGSQLYRAPELEAGNHVLFVKAFDRAGNFSTITRNFTTAAKEPVSSELLTPSTPVLIEESVTPLSKSVIEILSLVITGLALLLLLGGLVYLPWRLMGGVERRINREVLAASLGIQEAQVKLKADLEEIILLLKNISPTRKLTKEETKVMKRLRNSLDEAKKIIHPEPSVLLDSAD